MNDQLTGFAETKLAGGIKGDGAGERGAMSKEGPQTDNKHCIPNGGNRKMRM